ncbi:MAG: thioredoxin fold domain-containing protein [Pseudomonadota bacterium]
MAKVTRHISLVFLPFILFFALVCNVFAADNHNARSIKEVKDFSEIAEISGEKRLPLVLMFSSEYCTYCVRVESDFLIPMQISGDYEQRAIIRKMKIDFGNTVRDFDGKQVDADEFAARYNISVTPTVVFLDRHGSQLAPKRVGLMTPDFYGGYLDESIDIALDMLRRNKPLRITLSD